MPRHSFEQATFTRLTYCEHCNGLLWGLRYQGVRCKDCGYVCHTQCESAAPVCSGIGSAKSSSKDKYSSPAKESLRSLQRQINAAQSAASLVEDPADGLTLEKIQNIIVSAVVHAQDSTDPPSEYLANMPPLNPQISAKNFARFASRCGPMFAFRDAIILLLNWEKPMDTLVAMVAYCLICLHPKILLFIPQLVLLHIITSAYYKRYGQPSSHAQEEDASSKESSLESSSKAPVQRASKSSPTSRSSTAAASASDVQPNSSQNASARRPFTFNLASALFPTFDESSPEYLKNMQNLQNMMGEVSDIYDLVAANAHYFDWSSEADTMRVLQAVVFSMVVLLGLVWFIPLNIICLVTGVSVFLMNTRFAKYCIKEIMPYALKFGQTKMEYVARWYAKLERQLEEQERVRQVSLFENQRWWSGSGFAPQMLENERSPWSDLSGTIQLPPKEDMPAPKGYKWVQDDWKLDTTGPWINDVLNIEILVFPEEGGWVYSDNNWISYGKGTKDTNRQERLTRRRRWVRLCEKIQKPALENLHDM